MSQQGLNNVRGGSFTQIDLDNNTKEQLRKTIQEIENECNKCGGKGHFTINVKSRRKKK